jgi:hypothetical protein
MNRSWLCCALVLSALGCGDDDEGSSRPRYASGVNDTNAGVSTLDTSDQRRICESLDAYVQTNISFDEVAYIACLPAAIVLGGSPEGCEQQLDDCMALFPEPIEIEARLQDQQVCSNSLVQCEASVAQLEGCINLNLDLALDIIDNWSCNGAADQDQREAAARAMDTATVCADIDAACNRFASLEGPD